MSEPTNKKDNKRETPKVQRDKNGRFSSKENGHKEKPDDGSVKINVVKDKDNVKNEEQKSSKKDFSKADSHKADFHTFRVIGIPVLQKFPAFNWMDSRWDNLWNRMSRSFDRHFEAMERAFQRNEDPLADFIKNVDAKKPETISINGRIYYSEEDVANRIAQTISTCAKVATEEIEASESEKETNPVVSDEKTIAQPETTTPSIKSTETAHKMANLTAKVILWLCCLGIVTFSIVGLMTIVKSILR